MIKRKKRSARKIRIAAKARPKSAWQKFLAHFKG